MSAKGTVSGKGSAVGPAEPSHPSIQQGLCKVKPHAHAGRDFKQENRNTTRQLQSIDSCRKTQKNMEIFFIYVSIFSISALPQTEGAA